MTSVARNEELKQELDNAGISEYCATQCAHIFPESTNANISGESGAEKVYFFSYLI